MVGIGVSLVFILVIVDVNAFYPYYLYTIWLPVSEFAAFKLVFINDRMHSLTYFSVHYQQWI